MLAKFQLTHVSSTGMADRGRTFDWKRACPYDSDRMHDSANTESGDDSDDKMTAQLKSADRLERSTP